MDILSPCFRTLSYCGLWFEDNSSFVVLRRCWSFLLLLTIFYFTATEIIEFYLLRNNIEDLIDVMFLTTTYVLACMKILNFKLRRRELSMLLENFRAKICKPTSHEEETILLKYTVGFSKIFRNILVLSQATGTFFTFLPLVTLRPDDYVLPYKTYQFYDDTTNLGFAITYTIQFSALFFGIFINVSMDTMIYGFIILCIAQFELISYRIVKANKKIDKISTIQCIVHHVHVKEIVRKIENIFIGVITPLFLLSLLTLCASIFQMSQTDVMTFEFLGFSMYLSCMLCQIFFYCWYGNELKLKSEEIVGDIYGIDWTLADLSEKKLIRILMMLAHKSSTISFRGQYSLSLDTFVMIIKASYTAFNLLQCVSDESVS